MEGQAGVGTFQSVPQPTRLTGITGTLVDLQTSCGNAYVVRNDGTLVGWGRFNQMGTGTLQDQPSPVEIELPCP